ncbi:MAG: retropepsin-like aspartic protease [Caulobacteraceae bacterium]
MAPRSFGPAGPDASSRREQLRVEGHVLDVIIHREPSAVDEEGVPALFEAGALIDTGASDVCIDYRLAHELKLRQIDQQTVATPGGTLLAAVFLGLLEVPDLGYRKLMPLYALRVARSSYSVILGRSFLADYIVTFDGPNGCFHFALPQDVRSGEAHDE